MPERALLVLGDDGLTETLQPGDSAWSSLLFDDVADGLGIGFGERTTVFSDANSGLVLETNVDGDLFVIRETDEQVEFKFGADGTLSLPSVSEPEAALGSFWFNGSDLFIGGP